MIQSLTEDTAQWFTAAGADFDFWFAEYKDGHNEPSYPYSFQIWQYASDGRVDGIEGEVDMNICFADYGREER